MESTDVHDGNTLTNEVNIDLNMFHVLVLFQVNREIDDVYVVATDKCRAS